MILFIILYLIMLRVNFKKKKVKSVLLCNFSTLSMMLYFLWFFRVDFCCICVKTDFVDLAWHSFRFEKRFRYGMTCDGVCSEMTLRCWKDVKIHWLICVAVPGPQKVTYFWDAKSSLFADSCCDMLHEIYSQVVNIKLCTLLTLWCTCHWLCVSEQSCT